MKCDELKPLMCAHEPNVRLMYDKSEVDAAIAELNAENERLKKKMDDYHLMSDIRRAKIKELKRALWLARAEREKTEHLSKIMYSTLYRDFIAKWVNVERKCRTKAEEYK